MTKGYLQKNYGFPVKRYVQTMDRNSLLPIARLTVTARFGKK